MRKSPHEVGSVLPAIKRSSLTRISVLAFDRQRKLEDVGRIQRRLLQRCQPPMQPMVRLNANRLLTFRGFGVPAGSPIPRARYAYQVSVLALIVAFTTSWSLASARTHSKGLYAMGHTAYSIRLLGSLARMTPAALDDRGEVVGSLRVVGGRTHAFAYVSGRVTDLGTFQGMANTEARDVNDRGMIDGLAWNGSRGGPSGTRRAALVWIPRSHGYRRLRLRTGPLMVVTSLGQIDGRGDVAGDERPVRGSRNIGPTRAVVWLARATRYTQARYLPKPIGYRWTNASFIRRVRNRTLVVGSDLTSWITSAAGAFRVCPSPYAGATVHAVGGNGRHVFAIGSFDGGAAGYGGDAGSFQWAGPLRIPGDGCPNVGIHDELASGCAVGARALTIRSVAADRSGHLIAAGNTIQPDEAVLWSPGNPSKGLCLSSLLSSSSGWKPSSALDINNRGQIVGQGLHGGKAAVFLATLRGKAS